MQASQTLPLSSSTSSWPGRILSGIASLFLLMDAGMHIANPGFVVDASHKLGWAPGLAPALGIIQLACLALYLFPRTAILGAVLMTGYLGGAVATHVRAGSDIFSMVFPILIGALLWGGLYLRDGRVRRLLG